LKDKSLTTYLLELCKVPGQLNLQGGPERVSRCLIVDNSKTDKILVDDLTLAMFSPWLSDHTKAVYPIKVACSSHVLLPEHSGLWKFG